MKRLTWILSAILCLAAAGRLWAEDVVYLKDGSIIHGTITEEVPGVSVKIQTKDGNVFVYKIKKIEKITHSAPAEQTAPAASDEPAAAPAATPEPNNPNAKFDKFFFTLNGGFWGPQVIQQFNDDLEAAQGDSSLDYLPGWFKFGMGLNWVTNGFGFKWNLQASIEPNSYTTDWYYGGYYVGTTQEDTYLLFFGSELEADLCFDNVTNKNNATSFYIPLIVGIWSVDWNYTDSGGNSDDFTNTTTDFGTGIGVRGFDSGNFLWDLQLVYRWSARGNYLQDANGNQINYVKGGSIDANVSGLDLNCTIGFAL